MSDKTVIGIDLGGTNVRAGRVRGDRLAEHAGRPISANGTEDEVMNEVMEIIDRVWRDETAGIGIGVPSVVDVEKGIVYAVANIPSWKEVHLKDRLEKKYGVPVYVNNDANCFALGESYFGKARGFRNMVGLIVGTGLGAGVIIERRLYNGSNCGAGEFGHIPYKDHDLEYYCSGQRFPREFGVEGKVLFERARAGDEEALGIFRMFGEDLGQAIKSILYAVDPEVIVFGGSVSRAFPFFEGGMRKTLESFNYQHALERLVMARTEDPHIAILGAAALYFDSSGVRG